MLPASIASSFVGEARPSLLRTHRKLLTVAVGLLFFLFTSSYHYHHRQAAPDLPRPTYHSSYTSSAALLARPPATLPRAVLGDDGTNFTTFLDAHFPLDTPLPHIWLTLAEGSWVSQGTLALQSFVDQLNRERVLLGRKETALVTLCMDEECVKFAARNGMYAFGGFQFNRPEKILRMTWPKLAGLIEILKSRDTFFVDSDVAFKRDPYPWMEPMLQDYDVIAQENFAYDHFNTGWMWLRKGQAASDAWHQVLERDLVEVSRDQINFNEVLNTTQQRHCEPDDCWDPQGSWPLKMEFVVPDSGLRVKILDPDVFRSHHFELDVPAVARESSVYLHLTCGDDALVKTYVHKFEGFWRDVPEGYYSAPPKLLTVKHMSGSPERVTSLFKVMLAAAHYSRRAIRPPSHVVFTDVEESSSTVRRIYSAFPMPHLERDLGVRLVEPDYPAHATSYLLGGSVLDVTSERRDLMWSPMDDTARKELALNLHHEVELDMRQVDSLAALVARLTSPAFAAAQVVRLIAYDWPGTTWNTWTLPETLDHVSTCARLHEWPGCDNICRFDGDKRVRVDGGWPSDSSI